jgi:hypothetical protein
MKIKFTTSICGEGWAYSHGDTLDVTDAEGSRLIEVGMAEPVPADEELETATAPVPPTEKATVKTTRKAK